MNKELRIGTLALPEGWSARVDASFIEPPTAIASDARMRNPAKEIAGARITISRGRAENDDIDAGQALGAFIDFMLQNTASARKLADAAFVFDDGVSGRCTLVQVDVDDGMTWLQSHIYRVDEGIITHLTLSVIAAQSARLEGDLRLVAASYSPAAATR